jgi:hypothetical protein
LADKDELNKMDEPTADKPGKNFIRDESHITVNIPDVAEYESDSLSTFHPASQDNTSSPSTVFHPCVSSPPSVETTAVSSSLPSNI